MIFAKAKKAENSFTPYGEYKNRKSRKVLTYESWIFGSWKKALKRQTVIKSRRRKIEDETPYKKLSDPWHFD